MIDDDFFGLGPAQAQQADDNNYFESDDIFNKFLNKASGNYELERKQSDVQEAFDMRPQQYSQKKASFDS